MLEAASKINLGDHATSWQPGGKSFKVFNQGDASILQSIKIQIISMTTQNLWLP
jgi:hypothetical protein